MIQLTSRLSIALVLIAGALLCWRMAGLTGQLADRHERLATFQDDPAGDRASSSWLDAMAGLVDPRAAALGDAASYWRGRFDVLIDVDAGDDDRVRQMLSAHASYRQAQRASGPSGLSVDSLDQAIGAYASVLRNGGFDRDAAYNYEYLSRLRDRAARAKADPRAARAATPAVVSPMANPRAADDLPAGPTVHGRPGTHPQPARGNEFEVITPMNYGEREAQPEPTPGVKLPRKG
jgi:hypothetical protein